MKGEPKLALCSHHASMTSVWALVKRGAGSCLAFQVEHQTPKTLAAPLVEEKAPEGRPRVAFWMRDSVDPVREDAGNGGHGCVGGGYG